MGSQRVRHDWATFTFTYRARRYTFKISEMDEASGKQMVWNQNTVCKITPFKSLQWWQVDHSLSSCLLVLRQRQSVLWLTKPRTYQETALFFILRTETMRPQVWISVVSTKCLTVNEATGFRQRAPESCLRLQQACRRKSTGLWLPVFMAWLSPGVTLRRSLGLSRLLIFQAAVI